MFRLIIYDLNFMQNFKKLHFRIFLYYILLKKFLSFNNSLTFSKAFDGIPDLKNLGYQVEKLTYLKICISLFLLRAFLLNISSAN